jgi:thiol-disulfide isomerase/thioredoxin
VSRTPRGLALVCALLALTGCSTPPPGEARIDVDTAELRLAKDRAGVEPCPEVSPDPVEGGLPDLTLPCFGGGDDVPLSGLRGPLVVNLWASWCGPCRKEMPVLQEFHERHGDEVAVLGVNENVTQPVAAMELVEETGVTYPQVADPQAALDAAAPLPAIRGLPFLALVDEGGEVVHQEFVEIEDVDQLRDLVRQHLGVEL